VVNSCNSIQVHNLYAVMTTVHQFYDSHPKRQYVLDNLCEISNSKFKSLCKTRWMQRIEAFHTFMDLFDYVVQAFDHVVSNHTEWSRDAVTDAKSLCKAILDFEFIVTLYTVERYLSYTEGLTRSLQGRAIDIIAAINHIDVLKQVLTDAQSDIDRQFHSLLESASRFANKHNVSITTPRLCQANSTRQPSSYFCCRVLQKVPSHSFY